MGIPGLQSRGFFEREATSGGLAGLVSLFGVVGASIRHVEAVTDVLRGNAVSLSTGDIAYASVWHWFAPFLVAWSLLSVAVVVARYRVGRYKDRKEDARQSPADLRGCLHVALEVVEKAAGQTGEQRAVIHRVKGESFEQVTDYVPKADPKHPAGRLLRLDKGVIGKALQSKQLEIAKRPDGTSDWRHNKNLRRDYKFNDEEIQRLKQGVCTNAAVPLLSVDGTTVLGVLYMDSTDRAFFDDRGLQQILVAAAMGVAKHIHERYPDH